MTYSYARKTSKIWHTVSPGVVHIRTLSGANEDSYERNRYVLFALKQALVEAGTGAWTVLASSGKAGGGSLVADANDNWTVVDDLVLGATDADPRSWVLLRSPRSKDGGYYYLLIDYFGATEERVNYYFTRSQPDISSPSTSTRPPSTGNEWSHTNQYVCSSQREGQTWTTLLLNRAHDGSFVCGVCSPDRNSSERGQYYRMLFVFNVVGGKKPWDDTGAVSLVRSDWNQAIFFWTTMPFQTLHQDGSQVTCYPVHWRAHNTTMVDKFGTEPYTGGWPGMPVWLVCTTAGAETMRGWLEDLYWAATIIRDGVPMFSGGVIAATKMGPFTVPVDQIVGLV